MYLLSGWTQTHRFDPFQALTVQFAADLLDSLGDASGVLLIVLCIVQILLLGVQIWFLVSVVNRNARALKLLLLFDPVIIAQNANVMAMLSHGRLAVRQESSSFEQSEKVLENIREGVVLCDPDLVIQDLNDSFAALIGAEKATLRGQRIEQQVKKWPADETDCVEAFFLRIGLSVHGNGPPVDSEQLHIMGADGVERHVAVTVSYLNQIGLAKGTSAKLISAIALQFNDLTDQKKREDILQAQAKMIRELLMRMMPKSIVDQLSEGADSLAYAVQTASIGCIEVVIEPPLSDAAVEEIFRRWQKVFAIMDEVISAFPTLDKIRTEGNMYVFAGGMFGSGQKPEKQAEEATRFGLKLIGTAAKGAAEIGFHVDFRMGLNTGGPLVAGVMNQHRPAFQLIGPAADISEALMRTGDLNQVHFTRSVYELIYSHNFKVTERGDVKLRGGRTLRTYVIIPG
jgi:PAS domain-containing protein/class 3 adenylate cyclase